MRWLVMAMLAAALSFGGAAMAADDGHGHGPHPGENVSSDAKSPIEVRDDLAIYTLLVFALLLAALYKTAWPKITGALEEREAGIRQAFIEKEQALVAAAAMLQEHRTKLDAVAGEVKEILAEARRDAEQTKADILAAAATEATATKNRAIADIERARDQALNDLFDKMSTQVAAATEQVIGRTVTADDQNRLIREALSQVSVN
ncbi:MAG: ATP synthase F0 subunit B [Planctomyces sp.]|nr:ATP synthase F0 subunit B [Planctomyces sp.]